MARYSVLMLKPAVKPQPTLYICKQATRFCVNLHLFAGGLRWFAVFRQNRSNSSRAVICQS